MTPCGNCGIPVPAGARFCPACGTATSTGVQEERRIVTVLFADLVGYTSLAEQLDPEHVKRLIDGCFERLVDDVHAFGGRVDKILGDGILALFGAPVGHEDDPERAVRAGLRMHHSLAGYVASARLDGYGDIRLRIGINTGEVLVGKLAGTDYTALGDVVNTAHRLQAAAPIGGVLVGEETHALTAHSIRYDEGRRLQPKGREQSVDAWLAVETTLPPGAARRRQREVRLVGRDAELGIARAALDTVRERHSVLVAISGDNGVGTTRLLDELVHHMRLAHDAVVFTGAGVPYGESNVWWPLASAVSRYFDIDPSTPVEAVRSIIQGRAELLGARWTGEEQARIIDALVHMLGYPSPIERLEPTHSRQAIHHAVAQAFELRARRQPTVLAIDDFHWSDPAIVDLVTHLLHALNRCQFAVITAMRPGHDLSWPPRSDRVTVVSIPLGPLSRAETEELATELLGERMVSTRQLSELYERSGGNPLFLQELAALTEQSGEHPDLPATLRTLIGARLDQLTLAQRQIIDNAATLGNAGPIRDLEYFAKEMSQVWDPADLRALDELGLVEVQGRRWQFRSDSVREAAYQTLTKAASAQRHAGVARALRKDAGGHHRADDLAHHTATAAELVLELGFVDKVEPDIAEQAVELLVESARRSLEKGNLRQAARQSTRALCLLPQGQAADPTRAGLLLIRAASYVDQHSYAPARADLEAALSIAQATNDLVAEGEARRLRGSLASVESDIETARIELGRAVELLRMAGEPERLADALRSRGWIELFGGSIVDAEWFFGEADDLYRAAGDERGLAWIEQHRAWSSFLSGDMDAAAEQLTRSQAAFERIGDHNGQGWAGGLMAFVRFFQRDFEEAERLALEIGSDADARGDEWAAAMMQVLLAQLRMWEEGRIGEAETLATSAWRRLKVLGDDWGTMQALAPLVRAQVALGHGVAAQRSIEELVSLSSSETNGAFPLLAVAGAAMHRGDGASALDYSERTAEQLAQRQMAIADTGVVRAVALAQLHRLDEALTAVDEFPPELAEHPFAAAAAALVHSLSGDAKEALRRAEQVTDAEGTTYLDEVMAYIAAGNAHAQLDDPAQARLCLEAAIARAMGVGDVVATALATRAYGRVTCRRHPASDDHILLGRGWLSVIDHLTSAGDPLPG